MVLPYRSLVACREGTPVQKGWGRGRQPGRRAGPTDQLLLLEVDGYHTAKRNNKQPNHHKRTPNEQEKVALSPDATAREARTTMAKDCGCGVSKGLGFCPFSLFLFGTTTVAYTRYLAVKSKKNSEKPQVGIGRRSLVCSSCAICHAAPCLTFTRSAGSLRRS